jgi:hypothetical protein
VKHKLIIVDGPSTVGKSSISKKIYKQIGNQEGAYWLHEECEEHPIRYHEFSAGDIHSKEGMDLNRESMLRKWKAFKQEIEQSKKICITEGCFLHAIDRYLIESVWDIEQIQGYFNDILKILEELNPLIVFLYRPDLKSSFQKAFIDRGDRWKNLILKIPEPVGYFKTHPYNGDESIYEWLSYEQDMMSDIFDGLSCNKMKFDTSEGNWNNYTRLITEKTSYSYCDPKYEQADPEKFCGKYRHEDDGRNWHIHYDEEKKEFYTFFFWPYMPMKYLGNDQFELISFPVILHFDHKNNQLRFKISGNYDWDLNGKTFIRIIS